MWRLALALVALGLVGCHQDVELDPGAFFDAAMDTTPGTDTSLLCGAVGSACVAATECCSARCVGDVCVGAGCERAGATCSVGDDCCSGVCTSSVCAAVAGCAPVGEACASRDDCCSRTCAKDPRGVRICQSLGGCLTAGELCTHDTDCCGGVPGACGGVDPTTGIGRCVASTGCASPGEICRVAGDATATRECCPGGTAGRALCRPTRVGDADRCESAGAMSMCLGLGAPCATPDECCTMVCAPTPSAGFACAETCAPNGAACTRSADCCTGDCARGTCVGVRTCGPLGSPCSVASECCSGTCNASICAESPG